MEKVTLKEFFRIILKRKYLVLGIITVTFVISFVLNFFVFKSVFTGSANVFPAQVGNASVSQQNASVSPQSASVLLNNNEVVQIVTSDDFMQKLANKLGIKLSDLKNNYTISITQAQNLNQRLFVVNFQDTDKDVIKSFFDEFIKLLNEYAKDDYEQQVDSLKGYINQLNAQIGVIDNSLSDILKKMIQLVNKDGTVKSEYYLEYSTLRSSYESLATQELQIKQQIANLNIALKNSNLFYYVNGFSILDKPVKPRKVFNIGVSVVSAFLFSILLALFMEYWEETKNGEK